VVKTHANRHHRASVDASQRAAGSAASASRAALTNASVSAATVLAMTPSDVLGLQRVIGNQAIAQRMAARPAATPVVQRLPDRNALVAVAGAPTADVKILGRVASAKSVEYKAVLDQLDQYQQKAQQLWTAGADPRAVRLGLNAALDDVATACWAYLAERATHQRATHIRKLIDVEIPQERRRVATFSTQPNFAGLDRTRPVEEFKDAQPVRVTNMGIVVGETTVPDPDEGGVADCHSMSVWAEIDCGQHPARPAQSLPNSVYGVSLEYWENIAVDYYFMATAADTAHTIAQKKTNGLGAFVKPWSDILALQPDSPTFDKLGGPIQASWATAVTA
jgi:hypothetical protein